MQEYYIQAPFITETKPATKCKVQRIRCAKRDEVPPDYRKDRIKKLKEELLYIKNDLERMFKR